jgi:hypothetical protein
MWRCPLLLLTSLTPRSRADGQGTTTETRKTRAVGSPRTAAVAWGSSAWEI